MSVIACLGAIAIVLLPKQAESAQPDIPQPPSLTCTTGSVTLTDRESLSADSSGSLTITGSATYSGSSNAQATFSWTGQITDVSVGDTKLGCASPPQTFSYIRISGNLVVNIRGSGPVGDVVNSPKTFVEVRYPDAGTAQQAVTALRCIALNVGCDKSSSSARDTSTGLTIGTCKGAIIKAVITHTSSGDDVDFSVVNDSGQTLAVSFGPIIFESDSGDSTSIRGPGFGSRELHAGRSTRAGGSHPFDAPVNGDPPRIVKITVVNALVANLDNPPKVEGATYLSPSDYPDKLNCGPFLKSLGQ